MINGRRYQHILDPRSGWPVTGTEAVTVIAGDATLADAASTALFVAGTQWPGVARALGITQVLRIDSAGRFEATPQLASRLRFVRTGEEKKLRIVPL
jgi:thiamine biosynthesis lipoprotein